MNMRSWWAQSAGNAVLLEAREIDVPEPGAGQVLLRVHAAGLNRGEFIPAQGLLTPGAAKPAGNEAAGEVLRTGPGVSGFRPGERVMGRCAGAFAEFALMDARETLLVPTCLGWEEAAAVPLVFMVTHDMLIAQGHLREGEWLLVTGVSSGVGVASLQAAKALGAKVIGTSGSAEKLERLRAAGLDLGFCTRRADFAPTVLEVTAGRGANLAVNAVGGSMFAECLRALAFEGRLAVVGYVDGALRSEIDLEALHAKRLTIFGVSNKLRSPEQRATTVRGFANDLLPAIADGRIRPLVDRVFRFAELPQAKAYMDSDAQVGKIVLSLR